MSMSSVTNIIIAGAGGRMGRAIANTVLASDRVALIGAVDRKGADSIGCDIGILAGQGPCGVLIGDDLGAIGALCVDQPTVLIDFTMPVATTYHASVCALHNIAHVIGTTGLAVAEDRQIEEQAGKIPIVKAGNMSTGVTLLSVLVERAAKALGEDFDIEINESHHRHKVDAPSGTALLLGEAAAAGRGIGLEDREVRVRDGITGARRAGDIGFSVVRGGGVIGDHEVMFLSEGEKITLSHQAIDRGLFAQGALRAALWLSQNGTGLRRQGLYDMRDVLAL